MDLAGWAFIVAAASFAVSLVLGIRELIARPILVVWTWRASERRDAGWRFAMHMIHVANVGRAPAIVHGAGVLRTGGAEGYVGTAELAGHATQNPELPLTLAPGEVATFFLPAPRFPENASPLGIQSLRRRRLRAPGSARRAKVVNHKATEVLAAPEIPAT